MSRISLRWLAATAALSTALAGCSVFTVDASPDEASTPSGAASGAAADPGASTGEAEPAPGVFDPAKAPEVDVPTSLVPGVQAFTDTDFELSAQVMWRGVNGLDEYNRGAEMTALGMISERRGSTVDDTSAGGLVSSANFIATGPDVFGVRYTTVTNDGDDVNHWYRTLWVDVPKDQVITYDQIFADKAAADAVWSSITELAAADERIDASKLAEPWSYFVLADVGFAPSTGNLELRFDPGAIADPSAGALGIAVAADDVTPHLSDFGAKMRDASMNPTAVTVGGATATPAPTTNTAAPAPEPDAPKKTRRPGSVDCTVTKCVALTFDDGPGPYTQKLVDELAAANVPATFYMLGKQAEAMPDVVRSVVAAGHEVGNHTYDHPQLTQRDDAAVAQQMSRTDDILTPLVGSKPVTMRPPYGAHNKRVDAVVGKPLILWDVDTLDWKTRSAAATVKAIKKDTRPGSIILMHDIHEQSVAAVPEAVQWLKSEGYTLVTVSDLLASTNPAPGSTYGHGPRP